MIPRICHQIWYNFKDWAQPQTVPDRYASARASWVKRNPDFRIITWTEASSIALLQLYYPELLSKFLAFREPIQRADMFRWIALYHFGGIYADMDTICLGSFDKIESRYRWSATNDLLVVPDSIFAVNALILSTPRHPAILHLLEKMQPSWGVAQSVLSVFCSTGPAFLRRHLPGAGGVNNNNIVWDGRLMWNNRQRTRPADEPYLAEHLGAGAWNFSYYLFLDIVRLLVIVVVVAIIILWLRKVTFE